MAEQNKGFDPLASLFEVPEPGLKTVPDPSAVEAPEPTAPPPGPAQAAPPAPEPPVDKEAIARAVAKAAAARLAAQQQARAVETPKPVQQARPPAQAVPAPPAPEKAAAPAPPPPAGKPERRSRLDALASRAVRPRSALDAARQAAAQEATQAADEAKQARTAQRQALTDRVQALLPQWLPGAGRMTVERAMLAEQRPVLVALWRGHRAKFVQEGALERAVGAAAVLNALETVPEGRLVAAHVVTPASDYLVWLDLGEQQGSLLAAFANARAYFAAG